MLDLDVDEILAIDYSNESTSEKENGAVTVTFKDGTIRTYQGPELAEVLEILKHWTPPTA